MNKLIGTTIICVVLLAMLVSVGCSANAPAAKTSEPIRIGVVTALSGSNAENGEFQINGLKLGVEEVNAAGGVLGRKLELVVEDERSSNDGAVAAASKLTSRGDIVAIVGPLFSTEVQAMAPTIKGAGIPMLTAATQPQLMQQGNRWLFRVRANDSFAAKTIANYGVGDLGLKDWAVVHTTDSFGNAALGYLTDALKQKGANIRTVQGVANGTQDFTSVILAVKNSSATALATLVSTPVDIGVFGKQLRQLGITNDSIRWLSTAQVTSAPALRLAAPDLNGVIAATDFVAEGSAEAQAFSKKYQSTYKANVDLVAAGGYDAISVLAIAIKNANSVEPEKLRDGLLSIKGYKGTIGTYSYDNNGEAIRGYNVVKIENEKPVFVKYVESAD